MVYFLPQASGNSWDLIWWLVVAIVDYLYVKEQTPSLPALLILNAIVLIFHSMVISIKSAFNISLHFTSFQCHFVSKFKPLLCEPNSPLDLCTSLSGLLQCLSKWPHGDYHSCASKDQIHWITIEGIIDSKEHQKLQSSSSTMFAKYLRHKIPRVL